MRTIMHQSAEEIAKAYNKAFAGLIYASFVGFHSTNIEASPFKINDEVIYCANKYPELKGKKFRVIAVNQVAEHDFEYALDGFPALVWLEEIAQSKPVMVTAEFEHKETGQKYKMEFNCNTVEELNSRLEQYLNHNPYLKLLGTTISG